MRQRQALAEHKSFKAQQREEKYLRAVAFMRRNPQEFPSAVAARFHISYEILQERPRGEGTGR